MSTEPVSNFTVGPTDLPIVVPSIERQPSRASISSNAVVVSNGFANTAKRTIAPAPSWNYIEPATRKPGWVVSLGILAVLSTLLLGLWIERRAAESRVDSPADVPDVRSYLTGEVSQ